MAGNPNPNGKHVSIPMHFTSSLKIGVTKVEMNDPKLIEKKNIEKNWESCFACSGN